MITKNKCKMCGKCCENIYSNMNPDKIDEYITDPNFYLYDDFKIISKYWKYMGIDDSGNHLYKCKALKNGKCSVYEQRPSICSDYPWYDREELIKKNLINQVDCVFLSDCEDQGIE